MTPELTQEHFELLEEWRLLVTYLATVKPNIDREKELRAQIVAGFFPKPKEGVNDLKLDENWLLKATCKIDRKINIETFKTVSDQLLKEHKINSETLVKQDPVLIIKNYKALTEGQKRVFDQTLTIKPASPTLVLIPPCLDETT